MFFIDCHYITIVIRAEGAGKIYWLLLCNTHRRHVSFIDCHYITYYAPKARKIFAFITRVYKAENLTNGGQYVILSDDEGGGQKSSKKFNKWGSISDGI